MAARRMGGAKRYPSIVVCKMTGFARAQPILRFLGTHSEYPRIVFSNFGKRALISASRTTLRCSTPFFEVWINPASRRMRKWFDRVDLAMPGHGAAAVQDMQSLF